MKLMLGALMMVSGIFAAATTVHATSFTLTSPNGGVLPAGVSAVGGIVVDFTGLNGTRVVSQVAASTEFVGSPGSGAYPLLFGTQTGITSSVISALGGGLSSASFRITLFDGDNQAGNFDYNLNNLLVNSIDFGNFSTVATQETDGTGATLFSSGSGFGNDILGTGFFSSTDATSLALLYTSLASGSIEFRVADQTPGDQFYDFTQGLDASVINIGSGPVVVGPTNPGGTTVPEPGSVLLLAAGLAAVGSMRRRA